MNAFTRHQIIYPVAGKLLRYVLVAPWLSNNVPQLHSPLENLDSLGCGFTPLTTAYFEPWLPWRNDGAPGSLLPNLGNNPKSGLSREQELA